MAKRPKPLTVAVARRAVRWFQRQMGLGDWKVDLVISDRPPACISDDNSDSLGSVLAWPQHKQATVWLSSINHCGKEGDMLSTLFHECCHVTACDIGINEASQNNAMEYHWNRLGDLLAAAYRAGVGD